MSIFEKASRKGLRFKTSKGSLSTEQLWNLSLEGLDELAQKVNKKIKESSEVSFISKDTPTNSDDKLRLEILIHIIEYKMKQKEASKKRAETSAQREVIQEILLKKKLEGLEAKTPEELEAMLNS